MGAFAVQSWHEVLLLLRQRSETGAIMENLQCLPAAIAECSSFFRCDYSEMFVVAEDDNERAIDAAYKIWLSQVRREQ